VSNRPTPYTMRRVMVAAGPESGRVEEREGFVGVWEVLGCWGESSRVESRAEAGEKKGSKGWRGSRRANEHAITPEAGAWQGRREAERQKRRKQKSLRRQRTRRRPIVVVIVIVIRFMGAYPCRLAPAFLLPSSPRHKPATTRRHNDTSDQGSAFAHPLQNKPSPSPHLIRDRAHALRRAAADLPWLA
jgi:hypothetical protein